MHVLRTLSRMLRLRRQLRQLCPLVMTAATLALIATGCAGADGDTGATGPQGAKGDQGNKGNDGDPGIPGDKGDKGDKGEKGADGKDGACATRTPLEITGVTGNEAPVFPGQPARVRVAFQGTVAAATFQFIGATTLLAGGVGFADLPVRGEAFNEWLFTSAAEANTEYIVVVTDGCSMATYKFTVRTRAAYVGWFDAHGGVKAIDVHATGESDALTFQLAMCDPLYACFTQQTSRLLPGDATRYAPVVTGEATYDVFDATGPEILLTTPKFTFVPGEYYRVIVHEGLATPHAVTLVHEDVRALQDPQRRASFSFGNFVAGAATLDVAVDGGTGFDDVAFGAFAPSARELVPHDLVLDLDLGGDGAFDAMFEGARAKIRSSDFYTGERLEAPLSFADAIAPGDRVSLVAFAGADGEPRLLVAVWDEASGNVYQFAVAETHAPDASGTATPATPVVIPDRVVAQSAPVGCDGAHALACGTGTCCGAPDICSFDIDANRVCERSTETPLASSITLAAPAGCTAASTVDVVVTVIHDDPLDLDYALRAPGGAAFEFIGYTAEKVARFEKIVAFAGATVAGAWTLQITDTRAEVEGALVEWSIGVHCTE